MLSAAGTSRAVGIAFHKPLPNKARVGGGRVQMGKGTHTVKPSVQILGKLKTINCNISRTNTICTVQRDVPNPWKMIISLNVYPLFCSNVLMGLFSLLSLTELLKCHCDICKDENFVCETDGLCFTSLTREADGTLKYSYR